MARKLHRQAAQQEHGGVEKDDGWQEDWMPIADLLVGARIHVRASLTGEKKHHKHGKKHHVAGEAEEYKKSNAMQQFARTSALMAPVIVASAATAAGWAPINGRFAANSRFFPFRFRRRMRKGSGHAQTSMNQTSVKMSILSLWLGRISKETVVFL
jgi:hypothetical protein